MQHSDSKGRKINGKKRQWNISSAYNSPMHNQFQIKLFFNIMQVQVSTLKEVWYHGHIPAPKLYI